MSEKSEQSKREKMIQLIKERASSYVPEWRFDEENPDIGTALAFVYGEMMASVQSRYQRMMEKKQIDFLNCIGAELAPKTPASGFVSFGLVNDSVPETKVPAGTMVTADSSKAENGVISYETKDDILVTQAKLSCIYEVNDKKDYIGKCENTLFQMASPNQQKHELYIGHPEALQVTSSAWVTLSFCRHGDIPVNEEFLKSLLDSKKARITYSSSSGYEPFEHAVIEQGKLMLYKAASQPPWEKKNVNGEETYWIRIQILNFEPFRNFSFEQILLSTKTQEIAPDFVVADELEADLHRYFPFGERLAIFSEVYFASNEILGKHGAQIELGFYLSFVSVPLDNDIEETEVNWKWVMSETEFVTQKEYDISIARVIWEYYNGSGWARIYPDNTNEDVFSVKDGKNGQYVKVVFTCPMDMQQAFVNSSETYAIRAKIIKLNNPYKIHGNYMVPVLENTSLHCDYSTNPIGRVNILCKNNLEFRNWKLDGRFPFTQMDCDAISLYLGFTKPPKGGPIKMYLKFQEVVARTDANLVWEYWNGEKFEVLRVIDETVNFSKSGLVTFLGAEDFEKSYLFGEDRYWIRIKDDNRYYEQEQRKTDAPFLNSITMNTVKIENRELARTEYFQMEYFVRKKMFRLQKKDVQDIKVFVKEQVIGSVEEEWKEWERVSDFLNSDEQSRHYVLKQNEGIIQFGDGTAGRIPSVSVKGENIKVVYQCGGGLHTNVGEGQVDKLSQSIGFINSVRNVEPLSGGLDTETREHAMKRCSNQIRVQNRAVTARDYESLAYEASRRIEKVRCFPGKDENGNELYGAITLVLLLRNYKAGNTMFQGVRNTVEEYLKGKMPDNVYYAGKLFIREPVFITYQVKAVLRVNDFNKVFEVQKQVEDRMKIFFDPVKGNFDQGGWEMGRLPNVIQIRNMIHVTSNVEEVKSLFVTTYRYSGAGMEEVELEEIEKSPYVLPISGVHQVTVTY